MNQLTAGNHATGIVPSTFDDVQRVAKTLVAAGLGAYSKKANETEKIAITTAQIMTGLELGVPPMQAMSNIAIINGRPQVWGELAVALILAKGFGFDSGVEGKGDARVGWAEVTRPDGTKRRRTFSVEQAKQAGLWDTRATVPDRWNGGKPKPNDSPWFRYQDDMLAWKATARVLKISASDVMKGVTLREDMEHPESEPIDITPQSVPVDIPDIPEAAAEPDKTEAAPSVEEAETIEPLADEEGFIAKFQDQVDETGGLPNLIDEVEEGNSDLFARLSPDGQAQISEILESARA